ncbi:MAG: YgjV family protein [Lachnospiraceae bacterium]|nr:YgjV family protein [Lachnospiraceae bacterium]
MSLLLLGNILSFLGAMIMVLVGFVKSRKKILGAQVIQFILMGFGNLALGGVTAFITNMLSIVRNLICFRFRFTWPLKIGFIVAQVGLSVFALLNGQGSMPAGRDPFGIIMWFPIIGTTLFTLFLDVQSDVKLKVVIVISQVFWLIYDFAIMNFASLTFDILTIISTIIGIVMILRGKEKEEIVVA